MYFLDEPLYFLGRVHSAVSEGVLDPALLRLGEEQVALIFTDKALAETHLSALSKTANTVRVQCVTDYRAKEELFEAALARGAAELWLDAAPDGKPKLTYPLRRALDYVLSFKRQSACL